MPKVKYDPELGLFQELGSGIDFTAGNDDQEALALNVTRGVTLSTSPTTGIREVSGSLLQLKGRQEGLFFHIGGNQYISNNAYFDATANAWRYQTADASAFRWGFRAGQGCFDLEWAVRSTEAEQITSGSDISYTNMPSWGTGLSVSASLGAVTVGKKADRTNVNYVPTDGSNNHPVRNGANAMFDVTGSVKASASAIELSLAVSGSAEIGCGEPTAFLLLPRLSTTQRDALSAVNGMIIYNTEDGKFQGYQAGAWVNLVP